MVKEKVGTGEKVVAVLRSKDGKKRVIKPKWYSRFLFFKRRK